MDKKSLKRKGIPAKISGLRHSVNLFLSAKMKSAGWEGICTSHGGIIFALLKNDKLSMSEMAKRIERDPSTVTTLVHKLKKYGYVELIDNPKDMRSKLITLTDEGRKLEAVFIGISNELSETMLDGVTDEELELFVRVVEKMQGNLKSSPNL